MRLIFILLTFGFVWANGQVSLFRKVFDKLHEEPQYSTPPKFRNNINMNYIEQKLDNFNADDKRTWQMRYLSNDFYFKPGGTIFIYVGGEWAISEGSLRGGHMFDMAKEMNGYMFYTEHRYYGRSQPFRTLETENLKYLTVDQSLADLAHFIETVKATIPGLKDSKVIIVGGSYSATMVTWFSKLYPNLVNGAWASSAPLLAKVDFTEYKEVVGEAIENMGSKACYERIAKAVKTLEDDIGQNNLEKINKHLNLCDGFQTDNKFDVMTLFGSISDIFSGLVQNARGNSIKTACDVIMSDDDDVAGVAKFIKQYISAGNKCIDVRYQEEVAEMKMLTLDQITRQWFYQTCNEFGWYQTSGSPDQPFGSSFPVDFYFHICEDVYGAGVFNKDKIDANIKRTNDKYGGMNPDVKNVYFTHGAYDPWHKMGISCEGKCGAVVPQASHCNDLSSASSADRPEMAALKRTITELVKEWTS